MARAKRPEPACAAPNFPFSNSYSHEKMIKMEVNFLVRRISRVKFLGK
jgi:hypothetical protein